jgi:site-specific DNA-methyltransferase (adenine-specific)
MPKAKTVEHETPQWLFDMLNKEFHFTLDPCASAENAKCELYYTKEQDGLKQSWKDHNVFMNPPFGRELKRWVQAAYNREGGFDEPNVIVGLLPVYTSSKWFHDFVLPVAEIRFVEGRLYFRSKGGGGNAPFSSMVVIWGGKKRGLGPSVKRPFRLYPKL